MAWIALVVAGLLEVVWATTMKQPNWLLRPWLAGLTLVGVIGSLGLLSWSMRSLELGTAYLAWTGIGTVGTFLVGLFWLGESASVLRLVAAALIVAGLLLMTLASSR